MSHGVRRASETAVSNDSALPDRSLRGFVGYNLKRAYNAVQADVSRTLVAFDLRIGTFSVLSVISDTPGLRQSDVAAILSVERSNLVLIVDELERRKLIARQQDPADRRAYVLSATDSGQELYRRAWAAVRRQDQNTMAAIAPAERANLLNALQMIETTLREDRDDQSK